MSKFLFLMAAGVLVLGAQTPLGGPSLGFIFDARGQALRPILGIPGASTFGDPMATSAPLTSAAISLRQSVAIVNDGAWKAIGLTASSSATTVLPDGLPASGREAGSESGTAAVFYDSDNNALTVVTGIGSSSMAANAVDLSALPGALSRFAAGDDGSLLVSASVAAGGEALYWLGQDGSVRQLASLQATASILFWNHGASALVVDRAANQIWRLRDPGGNAVITLLASGGDGVSGPMGAALSADSKQLWIANAGAHTVLGINLVTRAAISLNCAFDLTTLVAMADGTTFRLNELDSGPLWILDTTPGADARVVFVPALPVANNTGEAAQ